MADERFCIHDDDRELVRFFVRAVERHRGDDWPPGADIGDVDIGRVVFAMGYATGVLDRAWREGIGDAELLRLLRKAE